MTRGPLIRGRSRVRIGAGTTGPGAALWVEGARVEESVPDPLPGQVAELVKEYKALATTWLKKRGAWQVVDRVQAIDDVSALADNSGYSPFLTTEQKVELLETADPVARLKLATQQLRDHLAEQDVAETIAKDVQEGVDKQQREFLLRRQLEAVRKELRELNGEKEGEESDDYRARVEAADLPEKVREAALKEVDKLERALRPVARGLLDPHLAGHRPGDAVERADRGRVRHPGAPRRCWTPSTPAWRT